MTGNRLICTVCGRVTNLDKAYKYIISIAQTGGRGRCSHARTLVLCQHCVRTHRTVMSIQRKSLDEENVLEFRKPSNTRRKNGRNGNGRSGG